MLFSPLAKQVMRAGLASLCIFSASQVSAAKFERIQDDDYAYAQLSSSQTQLPGMGNPTTVTMENVDAISGIGFHAGNTVEIRKAGVYVITATAQVGNSGLQLYGNLNLWLNLNDQPMEHTVVCTSIQGAGAHVNPTSTQTVVKLKKGDMISVGMAANAPQTGLVSTTDILSEDQTSSIIFTIYRIGSQQ